MYRDFLRDEFFLKKMAISSPKQYARPDQHSNVVFNELL